MKKYQWMMVIALAVMTLAAGLQACGKSDGNGTGGNVTFYGAGQ